MAKNKKWKARANQLLQAMALLDDLVAAAGTGRTKVGLTRRVAAALQKHVGACLVELGWCEGEAREAEYVLVERREPVAEITSGNRLLAGSAARAVLLSRAPYVSGLWWNLEGGQAAPFQYRYEPQYAKLGAERMIVLPLVDTEERSGYAAIGVTGRWPEMDRYVDELFAAITAILLNGQRHGRLIERVAKLSRRAHRESRDLRQELQKSARGPRLVARSRSMVEAVELADRVAEMQTTVLLRGESGTGKELLARRIHRLSSRAGGPFVQVNCGAMPEGLVESQLFGHEKGAFTGADSQHTGLFERADGGTLFLDEVAELAPPAQVKLLRVLQESEFEPVGGQQAIRVDVRVIAATHQPLEQMVQAGRFRSDLYYRLNVFPIVVPPLRMRAEDLPALLQSLLLEICHRMDRAVPRVTPETLARLSRHAWPGNVRELRNVLERAVILTAGDEIELPEVLDSGSLQSPVNPPSAEEAASAVETFAEASRRAIERALLASGGRIYGPGGAAERLDLVPSTLQSKMKRLGVDRRRFVREDTD